MTRTPFFDKVALAVAIILTPIGFIFYANSVNNATIGPRLQSEALSTPRLLGNYERFYDLKVGYDSQVAQARDLKAALSQASASEKDAARTDYLGVKAACRTTALTYNADSAKETRAALKSSNLPSALDPKACEE